MSQDQQPRPWWKNNRLAWTLAALALTGLVITTILGYWQKWAWIELLWRWLQLLIIPLVLALVALWFNKQTRKSEQAIAQDRVQEEALQRYLDTMQELILDKGLRKSAEDKEIRDMARVRTLAVLRSLDHNRKGQVVRFLHEAGLITGKVVREEAGERRAIEAIIDLGDANLSNANLFHANLSGADLSGAYLSGVLLAGANLLDAYLLSAHLSFARLSGAFLKGADLIGADLSGAGGWTNEQLARAESLVGATLPNGTTIITEDAWEEFKKQHRQ